MDAQLCGLFHSRDMTRAPTGKETGPPPQACPPSPSITLAVPGSTSSCSLELCLQVRVRITTPGAVQCSEPDDPARAAAPLQGTVPPSLKVRDGRWSRGPFPHKVTAESHHLQSSTWNLAQSIPVHSPQAAAHLVAKVTTGPPAGCQELMSLRLHSH